jgi:2-polyprenyl-6-methoxyphenol hydroxylase-like FAD-dependent oxidoreductase
MRHVVIVGAGLAGLTAALAAAAAGAKVDVVELADGLPAPTMHVEVVPNLLRDLVALGLGEACVRRGFPYRGMSFVDADGRLQFELETPALAGVRMPAALGMACADLLRVIHDAAVEQGVTVHWRTVARGIDSSGACSRIALAGGTELTADVVVLAGASKVSGARLALDDEAERLPQRWDHVLIPRPRGLDRTTWVAGARSAKVLLVPTGVSTAGLAVLRDERAPDTPVHSRPAQLRDTLAAEGPMLRGIASLVRDDLPIVARPVRTGLLREPWNDGAVLRIGHSAHRLPPHFGQAAAQCVEDARVLGELLRDARDREELFESFMARRAHRAAQVHSLTTQAARWDLDPEPSMDLFALAQRLAPIVAQPA